MRRLAPRHWWLALLLACCTGVAPAAFAQGGPAAADVPLTFTSDAEEHRFHALVAELRCVMCQNQSLADSNAMIARDLRREVLDLMRQGKSDAQIKDFLVERYGQFVLYRPQVRSGTWLLWFGPALLLLVGGVVVARIVRQHGSKSTPSDDGQNGEFARMTAFIIAASVLALLSLAFVLRPLWQDRRLVGVALTLSLALVVGLLYTQVGTPRALDPVQRNNPATLDDAIVMLRQRLEENPEQVEGWRLLGQALSAQGQAVQARDAYAKAAALAPQEPDVLTEAAEARAQADPGRRFDDAAVALLRQAVAKQPMHQRARWFLGIAQRQAQQPAEAAKTWEPLLLVVDSQTAAGLREQIDKARIEAGLEPLPAAAPKAGGMKVRVALDPSLKLPPGATLFVIARQPGGPPMPVAAEKISNPTLPLEIVLDDADSPMPTLKLSALPKVELVARLSTSGDAAPRAGDLESRPLAITQPAGAPVELLLDHARD